MFFSGFKKERKKRGNLGFLKAAYLNLTLGQHSIIIQASPYFKASKAKISALLLSLSTLNR
jgi:hypothetical protein